MSQRPNAHVKKPSGGRPAPKRLFSFDSLRKDKSVSSADGAEKVTQNGSTLRLVEKTITEDAENPFTAAPWTDRPLLASPKEAESTVSKQKARRKPSGKPSALNLNSAKEVLAGADDAAIPPSPSRRRWDTIRHHVLPVPVQSTSGTETPPRPASPLDAASIISVGRPATPKAYRFGQKRNVRQLVDEVRAIDEARKYAEEIRRACWAVRFGE